MIIQNICNCIIIAGGVIIAIKNIAEWFGKPINFFKNKTDKALELKVKELLNKMLPEMLKSHDLEIRDRYRADRENYLQDIKREVLKSIQGELGQVAQLSTQYEALAISAKDVLREKIVCLYENNKDRRSLRFFERKALKQYYKDYKKMGGNSYIDLIYGRMELWDTEEDDYQ